MPLAGIQIVQPEALEIRNEDIPGQFVFFETREVIFGLLYGLVQVFASRLVFYQNMAFPQQVNKAGFVIGFLYRSLEGGYPAARNAEHLKEAVPKGFGFGVFAAFVLPFFGKSIGAGFDFVPTQCGHGPCVKFGQI